MAKEIRLSPTKVTIVDDEDFEFLSQWNWGFDGRYAYRRIHLGMDGKKQITQKIYIHKIINATPEGFDTDHINRDKLDNRGVNLRTATRSQNGINKPKLPGATSRYKGVCWHSQRGKWRAEIKRNGVKKYLGVFDSEEAAAEAYRKAANEIS